MPKGGRRKGAGRKPRTDGRDWHIIKIPLTDDELERILQLTPDERRGILLSHCQSVKLLKGD